LISVAIIESFVLDVVAGRRIEDIDNRYLAILDFEICEAKPFLTVNVILDRRNCLFRSLLRGSNTEKVIGLSPAPQGQEQARESQNQVHKPSLPVPIEITPGTYCAECVAHRGLDPLKLHGGGDRDGENRRERSHGKSESCIEFESIPLGLRAQRDGLSAIEVEIGGTIVLATHVMNRCHGTLLWRSA